MTEIEKLKKEIEDLKLIIESKNNQVESKNKHIKRLERIISNIKKNNPNECLIRTVPKYNTVRISRGGGVPRTDCIKISPLPFL